MSFQREEFPKHLENISIGVCSRCKQVSAIIGRWGSLQEVKLCRVCDQKAYKDLLRLTERWDILEQLDRSGK